MAGNVTVVYDAETAKAVGQLLKVAEANKKIEGSAKGATNAIGQISQANMKVGQSGQSSGASMLSSLRGVAGGATALAAAVAAIGSSWDKAAASLAKYRQQQLDAAALQEVRRLPGLKKMFDDPKLGIGVSSEKKFALYAGLQSEMGQNDAMEAYKTTIAAANIVPQAHLQQWGHTFSKIKSSAPQLTNKDAMNATMSVYQNLRGNLGNFDEKQFERMLADGMPLDKAIGATLSFGRSAQGGKGISAALAAIDEDRTFGKVEFGQTLSAEDKALREFYAKDKAGRSAIIWGAGNEATKKAVLGSNYLQFKAGAAEAEDLAKQFRFDVESNTVGKQARFVANAPDAREAFEQQLIDKHVEERTRGSMIANLPFVGGIVKDLHGADKRWQLRGGTGQYWGGPAPIDDVARQFSQNPLFESNTPADKARLKSVFDGPVEVKVVNPPSAETLNSHNE